MSIEEKAKAYDKALEKAKKYMKEGYTVLMPDLFPELRESDDERIRKEIIDYLNFAESHNLLRAADYEKKKEWISYLEKQKDAFENGRQLGIMQEQARQELEWPDEKQKEQKLFDDTQEYLKGVDRVQNYKELTKFEKGFDRIADTYAHRKNKDGYNQPWYTKERAAEMLYWAKEELGLLEEQKPIENVIKSITKNKETAIKFLKSAGIMDDNGELAEIYRSEQKSIPKFKVGDKIVSTKNSRLTYEILEVGHINELRNIEYKVEIFVDGKSDNPNNIKYMECDKVDEWGKLIDQKPTWSEEDERMLNSALWHVKNSCGNGGKTSGEYSVYNWLKDIRNRFQLQPKQEWNEEDKEMLNSAIKFVEHSAFSTIGKGKNNVLAWLKSLPEIFNLQSKVQWSEEDKKVIERAIDCVRAWEIDYCDGDNTISEKLKSIRPQSHWKPSKEQMEALRNVAYENGNSSLSPYSISNKTLASLYEQLKKL